MLFYGILLIEIIANGLAVKTSWFQLSTIFFQELLSVQGQLVAERSRCFKLEVSCSLIPSFVEFNSFDTMANFLSNGDFQAQITELQKMLESMQSIENDVQALRRQKSDFERDVEVDSAGQRQGSGGVWRWIAGGTGNG